MDMRVVKTKKNIEGALIRLLNQKPFEKITVSEICREGMTSRITFYTYYQDKYALIDEMFVDYIKEADRNYHKIRDEVTTDRDSIDNYEIVLECILRLYYDHFDFFSHTSSAENPYLFSELHNHVFDSVVLYLTRHKALRPKYSTKQTAALLCSGFFGVINTCISEKMSEKKVREVAHAMFRDILMSDIFERA